MAVQNAIVSNGITVVLYLIDAYYLRDQIPLIQALAEAKKHIGEEVHFVYVCDSYCTDTPIFNNLLDNRDQTVFGLGWFTNRPRLARCRPQTF